MADGEPVQNETTGGAEVPAGGATAAGAVELPSLGTAAGSSGSFGGSANEDGGLGVRVDEARTRSMNIGKEVHHYEGCVFGAADIRSRELTREHFEVWKEEDLARFAGCIAHDVEEVARLEEALETHRMLILGGEREVGKGALALFLASRLPMQGPAHEVLCSPGLLPGLRVNFEKLTGDHDMLAGRVVVLRDAFASKNEDLLRFVGEIDSGRLGRMTGRLEDQGTFLILTSDSEKILGAGLTAHLRGLRVLHEVRGPDEKESVRALCRRAEDLAREDRRAEALRPRMNQWLDDWAPAVVERLRTMPRIVQFVVSYLLDVVEERLPLDQALDRIRRREDWLFSELAEDFNAWCFVLALILAQPVSFLPGVPWHQFYRFWQAIAKHLRRELRIVVEPRSPGSLLVDRTLLEKARAEVRHSPEWLGDSVRFQAAVDVDLLWEALRSSGRAVLSFLVPLFTTMAEEGDFALREASARALGRIGRLDPSRTVFPLIHEWARSRQPNHHIALGLLCQGALGTEGRDEYTEACLQQLRRAALNDPERGAWQGAVALREIGRMRVELAVRELVDMLAVSLDGKMGSLDEEGGRLLRHVEAKVRRERSVSADALEWAEAPLLLVTDLMFDSSQQRTLAAVQYALVGLCFAGDPVRVLDGLRTRLAEKDDGKIRPALTLLLLRTDGIADVLERNKLSWPVPDPRGQAPARALTLSEIAAAASYGEDSPRLLLDLLEEVWIGAEAFPGWFCRAFRSKFVEFLKTWSKDACALPETKQAWEAVLAGLLTSRHSDLKASVFDLLQRGHDFTAPGSTLEELALNALTRRPPSLVNLNKPGNG